MDVTGNESASRHRSEEHPAGHTEALDRLDPSSRAEHESSRGRDHTSEARAAKIRALQDAIANGTYHVVAEKLADKMLRDTLRNQLP
jgi:flagellar biosynthesis anti-sigma factor FlgM